MSKTDNKNVTCLIVGAGLAGLIAARELQRSGIGDVLVLDKGRGVGGRLATRRIGDRVFDHGAQFFTVREPEFGKLVDEWLRAGVVREWCRGFAGEDGMVHSDAHPRFCGTNGMTGIAKYLAEDLNVHTGVRVKDVVAHEGGWYVNTDDGVCWRAASVMLTSPVPQSLALIDAGGFALDNEVRTLLNRISYDPCIALMVTFDGVVKLPEPGALQIVGGDPVYWVADNYRKGVSPHSSAFTLHAGADFSRSFWEADDAGIVATLTGEIAKFLRGADGGSLENYKIETWQVKRWLYSKPKMTHPEPFLAVRPPHPLVFAGDAFGGARVEGATLSGLAAARELASSVDRRNQASKSGHG